LCTLDASTSFLHDSFSIKQCKEAKGGHPHLLSIASELIMQGFELIIREIIRVIGDAHIPKY
jgi:hypothetical protein